MTALSVDKHYSNLALGMYDFDPDATTATDIGWVPTKDLDVISAQFFRTVGTSALTAKWIVNTAADGSGTDADLKTIALSDGEPNAVGDYYVLPAVRADEIAQLAATNGVDYKGISLSLAFATGTDEAVINYVRTVLRRYDGLTVSVIA